MRILLLTAFLTLAACQTGNQLPEDFDAGFAY
ncbi:MAG: DNA polymerase III subunit chi [Loktanella sp.]|nr:DNA polymerase III subunit chi [Loktanella sp.]